MSANERAEEILAIYRFYNMDGKLYRTDGGERLDDLFDAIIHAIDDCGDAFDPSALCARKSEDGKPEASL